MLFFLLLANVLLLLTHVLLLLACVLPRLACGLLSLARLLCLGHGLPHLACFASFSLWVASFSS